MAKLNIPTDGGSEGVTVVNQRGIDLLINRQAACISTLTYNEYWQVIDAGFRPDDLVVFKYSEEGLQTLEDGLYASGERLKEPAFAAKLARFVAASNRGWAWAIKNQDEAVNIVLAKDATRALTEKHQKRMMGEVAKLITDRKIRLATWILPITSVRFRSFYLRSRRRSSPKCRKALGPTPSTRRRRHMRSR